MSSPGVSQGKLFLGGEKKDLGCSVDLRKGERRPQVLCLCDVTGSGTSRNTMMNSLVGV